MKHAFLIYWLLPPLMYFVAYWRMKKKQLSVKLLPFTGAALLLFFWLPSLFLHKQAEPLLKLAISKDYPGASKMIVVSNTQEKCRVIIEVPNALRGSAPPVNAYIASYSWTVDEWTLESEREVSSAIDWVFPPVWAGNLLLEEL
jgi:hypothetical protein